MIDTSSSTIAGQVLHDPAVAAAIGLFLTATLKLVALAVTTLAGFLIKTKLNAENSTWKQKIAFRLVCYAEQKFGDQISTKRTYVTKWLVEHFPQLNPDEIDHLLEEAVVQLKSTQAGNPTVDPGQVK